MSATNDDLKSRLTRLLIDEVGPALQLDGSAIEVVGIDDGFAQLRLGQVCAGCPSTLMVLIHGLESELRQRLPEIRGIEVLPG